MPELRFPSTAVWAEFELETDLISPARIRLLVKPCFKRDVARSTYTGLKLRGEKSADDLFGTFERTAAQASKLVQDWDLTQDGEPVPCSDENKKLFLEPLLWENVVPEPEPAESKETIELGGDEPPAKPRKKNLWLFGAITDFACKTENFLKN